MGPLEGKEKVGEDTEEQEDVLFRVSAQLPHYTGAKELVFINNTYFKGKYQLVSKCFFFHKHFQEG